MAFNWDKKNSGLIFVTVISGSLLFLSIILSCSGPKDDSVKIGFVATLSGRFSDSGIKARNGVELAVSKINAEGGISGRKVSLMIKDNLNDEKTNAKVIKELIDQGAVVIIGPLKSSMAASSLGQIKDRNILMISPTISTAAVKDLDDNFLRIIPVATNQATGVAEKIIEDGHKNVSVVYDASNLAYSEPLYWAFKKFIEGHGSVVNFAAAMDEKSAAAFDKVSRKLAGVKPDALFLIASGIDSAFLCQQIHKIGLKVKIYGSYWVKSGNLIEEGGRSVEGITIITPYSRPKPNQDFIDFKEAYINEYGIEPKYLSIYSYDAVQVAFQGIIHSRIKDDASAIKDVIIKQKVFKGLEDDLTINHFGDAIRKDMFITVRNGKFERIPE